MGDDDRRKKSWREIDRNKDKSDHVDRGKSGGRGGSSNRSNSRYKSDLDKLFRGGGNVPDRFKEMMGDLEPEEGTPEAERKAAIQALRKAEEEGFRAFVQAVNEFRKSGIKMPDDENLLIRMLDHPDERVVRDVLEHYLDLADRRELERTGPLKSRLSTVETMTDDPRTISLVEKVRALIG
jgi:hypothetical protein